MNARDELYAVLRAAGEDRAEAERLIAARDAEVLREAERPALDALSRIYTDIATCRSGGDEWASEWLGEMWATLPLEVRAAAGDATAADELATTAQFVRFDDARHTLQQNRQGGAQ